MKKINTPEFLLCIFTIYSGYGKYQCVQGQAGGVVTETAWMGNVMNLFKGAAITQNQPTVALQGAETALPILKAVKRRLKNAVLYFIPRFSTIAIN